MTDDEVEYIQRLEADVERLQAAVDVNAKEVDKFKSAIANAYTDARGPYTHATAIGNVKRILADAGAEAILKEAGISALCKWGVS